MRKEFERTTPESVGIKSQDILHYIDTLEHSTTEMHGLMIMRHGKICTEGWWAPYAPNLRHGLQSHTKTYAATAVGIAYTQGILKLDERLIDIFPEESPENPSENLKKLTVRDVLCMGCGMDEMPRNSEHWIHDFMHIPVNHEPGTTFMYNSTGSTMLGAIVRKKTGKGLHEFLTENLFLKIGIDPSNLRWYCMADGMETGGGGLLATLEDNLRLMKLYADGGVWEGERILAEDYVKMATSIQNESATESINNPEAFDNFLGYGFQIWMCKPKGVYRADGAMGQFTIVCPEQDMIISITETAVGAHWAQNTLDLTWDFLEKIGNDDLAEDEKAHGDLLHKLARLNVPNPAYRPFSPMVEKINGKKFKVESGFLSPEMPSFMGKANVIEAAECSFSFDNYGCVWNITTPAGEQVPVRVATYGGRFTNVVKTPADQIQLLCTSGHWEDDNTFQVVCRWIETCLTKKVNFHFDEDGSGFTVDASSNSAFPTKFDPKFDSIRGVVE